MVDSTMKLRPEVQRFAEHMEAKLRTHDGFKGMCGWYSDPVQLLLSRACEELEELVVSFSASRRDNPFLALAIAGHHLRAAADVLKSHTPTLTSDFKSIKAGIDSVDEAVDVANFCMMIVDVLEGRRVKKASTRKT
jgi:hypothetical protein